MSLAGLLNILDDDPQLRDVLARAGAGTDPVETDLVAPPALRPVLAAALALGGRTLLAVTATAREAEDLTAGLGSFLPPDSVAYFPCLLYTLTLPTIA
jgi:transcription-repair coupling factor (superfamily II helicase)